MQRCAMPHESFEQACTEVVAADGVKERHLATGRVYFNEERCIGTTARRALSLAAGIFYRFFRLFVQPTLL